MNEKIKVLIGDDTAGYGVGVASQLRTNGLRHNPPEERADGLRGCHG